MKKERKLACLNFDEKAFNKHLDQARLQTDWAAEEHGKSADDIIALSFQKSRSKEDPIGRQGFNHLLDLADRLVKTPELALINHSVMRRELDHMPQEIVDFFDPMEAPAWVDAKQLEMASEVWHANTVSLLLVLYSSSLPACYLIKRGIPALYETGKLAKAKYISQRLFETALMLDTVMNRGGLKIIQGVKNPPHQKRYLWGQGFLAAKKIRALHASMRWMLSMHGEKGGDTPKWNVEAYGKPINQEDLAFTLLTFGYLLPQGIEHWGCSLTLEQKNAFLHLWKVVGHVMGIRPDLTTDSWEEAEELYQRLLKREAGGSEAGVALTGCVMDFVSLFLPKLSGLEKTLPASFIIDQCGVDLAKQILAPDCFKETREPLPRIVFGIVKASFWIRYQIRDHVLCNLVPILSKPIANLLHSTGAYFFQSFQDAYDRKPFAIPVDARLWTRKKGTTEAFLAELQDWRCCLFNWVALSLAGLTVSAGILVMAILSLVTGNFSIAKNMGITTLGILLLSGAVMKWKIPQIARNRPQPTTNPS